MVRKAWEYINTDTGLYFTIGAVVLLSVALWTVQRNSKLSCSIGLKQCVIANGRLLPVEDAQKILDDCEDFTQVNIGLRALSMSTAEILEHNEKVQVTARGPSPLLLAHFAFERLYDSDLPFERKFDTVEQRFQAVANACSALARASRDPMSYTR